jgi:hypothetical protein
MPGGIAKHPAGRPHAPKVSNRRGDPALGRFISPDTVTSGSDGMAWERYAYVRDNPLRYTDPSGNLECLNEDCSVVVRQLAKGKWRPLVRNRGQFQHRVAQARRLHEDPESSRSRYSSNGLCIATYCTGGEQYWAWWNDENLPLLEYELVKANDELASGTEGLGLAYEYAQGASLIPPGPYGVFTDLLTQSWTDMNRTDLSPQQLMGRAALRGMEGVFLGIAVAQGGSLGGGVGILVGSGIFGPELGAWGYFPGWVIGAGAVHYAGSMTLDRMNEEWVYPALGFGVP